MKDFVVFGAGRLGRRVADVVKALAFCDNNRSLWGQTVDGIPVDSPEASVLRFPEATFVVAIWHPSRTESMVDHMAQLQALGAREVIPFTALLAEFGAVLLPNFFWERPEYYTAHAGDIARARALLDKEGQEEFDRQYRLRLGDHAGQVIDPGVQYFPADLFNLRNDEVFVDCGAYDGDTIAAFREASHDRFNRLIAFEPDAANFASLKAAVDGDERITLLPYATGARREILRFSAAGTGSHISESGSTEVQVITLDEALREEAPTYIKWDIEGSELDALEGAREIITRFRPKLAVCVYHLPDHLWRVPLRLHALLPDARLTLRTYNADGLDCVCYCIPS